MDELEPLRRALDDAPEEAALRRVQAAVRARRAARSERGPAGRRAVFAAVLVAAAALFVLRARAPGPLRLADGTTVPESFAAVSTRDIRFADGSHVQLAAGSTLETLEASAGAARFVLRRGAAHFAIPPGGPRRWVVRAGTAEVEVVGTIFRVARGASTVAVAVQRGVVWVRAAGLADGLVRLRAGQRVEVPLATSSADSAPERAPVAAPPAAPPPSTDAQLERPARSQGPRPGSGDDLQSGRTGARTGDAPDDDPVERAFELAESARRAGRPQEALAGFEQLARAYPDDPRAALAMLRHADLLAGPLGRPAESVASYDRSLALGLPRSVREAAFVRRAEAAERAGHPEAARYRAALHAAYPDSIEASP